MKESEKEMVAITSKAGRSAARLSRPDAPSKRFTTHQSYTQILGSFLVVVGGAAWVAAAAGEVAGEPGRPEAGAAGWPNCGG